jgi:hypothetical protein
VASAMPSTGNWAFPKLPANRTYRRHGPNDANDPERNSPRIDHPTRAGLGYFLIGLCE